MSNATYRVKFNCHVCPEGEGSGKDYKYHGNGSIYDIAMSDDTCHALECKHCGTPFLLEHLSMEAGHGRLHSGMHSRIIHYKAL